VREAEYEVASLEEDMIHLILFRFSAPLLGLTKGGMECGE